MRNYNEERKNLQELVENVENGNTLLIQCQINKDNRIIDNVVISLNEFLEMNGNLAVIPYYVNTLDTTNIIIFEIDLFFDTEEDNKILSNLIKFDLIKED